MSELVNENAASCINRVEERLKNLSDSLRRLEEKNSVEVSVSNEDFNFADDINGDLNDVKISFQRLRNMRQDMYRYTLAQNRQKNFIALDEIKKIADVMTGLEERVGDLLQQCAKLELTRQNLEKFSADDTLNEI